MYLVWNELDAEEVGVESLPVRQQEQLPKSETKEKQLHVQGELECAASLSVPTASSACQWLLGESWKEGCSTRSPHCQVVACT